MTEAASSIPLTQGRFGSIPEINENNLHTIRAAQAERDAYTTFDKIKDWFCRTHRVEAKKCVYRLFHNESKQDVINAFFKLKELASEPFKDKFKSEMLHDGQLTLTVNEGWESPLIEIKMTNNTHCFNSFHNALQNHDQSMRNELSINNLMPCLLHGLPEFPKTNFYLSALPLDIHPMNNQLTRKVYRIFSAKRNYDTLVHDTHELTVYSDNHQHIFLGNLEHMARQYNHGFPQIPDDDRSLSAADTRSLDSWHSRMSHPANADIAGSNNV